MQRQFKEFAVSRREHEQSIVGLAENSTYDHHLSRRLTQTALDEEGNQRKQRKNKQGAISLTTFYVLVLSGSICKLTSLFILYFLPLLLSI